MKERESRQRKKEKSGEDGRGSSVSPLCFTAQDSVGRDCNDRREITENKVDQWIVVKSM